MKNTSQNTPQQMPGDYFGSKTVPEVSPHEQAHHLESVTTPDHNVFPVPETSPVDSRTVRGVIPLIGHETPEQISQATAIARRAEVVSTRIRDLRNQAAHHQVHGAKHAA